MTDNTDAWAVLDDATWLEHARNYAIGVLDHLATHPGQLAEIRQGRATWLLTPHGIKLMAAAGSVAAAELAGAWDEPNQ